jgi:hypothetical protein
VRKHCLMTSAPTDPGRMREGVAVPFGHSRLSGESRLRFITLAAPLADLGLAVLGWGGLAASSPSAHLIALTIARCVLSDVALFSSGNPSPGEREDRANFWVIVAFTLIGLHDAPTPLDLSKNRSTPLPAQVGPRVVPAGKRPDPGCVISSVSHQHQLLLCSGLLSGLRSQTAEGPLPRQPGKRMLAASFSHADR